jgi:hypothetical protein
VEAVTTAPARRPRRQRSVTEMLLSIVLGLEAVLVFFVTLTAFGLRALEAPLAFGGGAALIVALLLTGRLLMYPWGVWIGWALQAVLLATGVLIPLMYFIAACFLAIWIYCFVKGRSIDRQKAAFAAQNPTPNTGEDS